MPIAIPAEAASEQQQLVCFSPVVWGVAHRNVEKVVAPNSATSVVTTPPASPGHIETGSTGLEPVNTTPHIYTTNKRANKLSRCHKDKDKDALMCSY